MSAPNTVPTTPSPKPVDATEPTITITLFKPGEKAYGIRKATTWKKLFTAMSAVKPTATILKEGLDGWAPATFIDDHRKKDAVLASYAAVFDFDNAVYVEETQPDGKMKKVKKKLPDAEIVTLDSAMDAFPDLHRFAYTSWSHAPDWPHLRLVIPYTRAVTGTEQERIWEKLACKFTDAGLCIDTQCKDASRLWFLPARRDAHFETKLGDGMLFDVDSVLAEPIPTADNVGADAVTDVGIDDAYEVNDVPDANDYALAGKSLTDAVRGAEWIGKGSAITAGKIVMEDPPSTAAVQPMVMKPTTPPMSATTSTNEMLFTFGDRRWRVRGIDANTSYGDLRVNVLVTREHAGFHIDTLDLYSARHRLAFVKQAAIEIAVTDSVVKAELGSILLELEARVDEQIRAKLAPVAKTPAMTDAEEAGAMALLRDPKLTERITADLDRLGLIGEISNKLIAYLVTISRKLDNPLAVVVQSSSAAGKTSLVDAVLDLVPPEDRVSYSAMTGQSLFYMGDTDLKHKVLSVAEGEGAKSASYPLKLLQSEGKLSIASTGKDPVSGRLVTHTYSVTGPVATMLTTTAIDLDDELVNRCLVLAVDEGAEQTRAIHVAQRSRETLAGVLARRDRDRIVRVHRNAQRLLRPIVVVNPFADTLAFTDTRTRSRRDHAKLLTLVRAITLLHQHQRPVKIVEHEGESVEFIEATTVDIELATKLLADVLAAPENELPPVTRNILAAIESFVTARAKSEAIPASDVRFTKRDLRAHVGLGHAQVTTHLQRLEAMEYVHVHRSERTFRYALYDRDLSGQKPICRGGVGHLSEAKADTPGIRDHEGKGAFQPNGRPSGVHVNGAVESPGRT